MFSNCKLKFLEMTASLCVYKEYLNTDALIMDEDEALDMIRLDYLETMRDVEDLGQDVNIRKLEEHFLESFCDKDKTIDWLSDNLGMLTGGDVKSFVEKISDKCLICFEQSDDCLSLACKHTACISCFKAFIKSSLLSGINNLKPKCFYPQCEMTLGPSLIRRLHKDSTQTMKFYYRTMLEHYLDGHPQSYFLCKSNKCKKIISVVINPAAPSTVVCACLIAYCTLCHEQAHVLLSCKEYSSWRAYKSEKLDKANDTWIRKNTKPCPNCNWAIEKNDGCLHMVCLKCKHEFCWVCITVWKNHKGTSLYDCNTVGVSGTADNKKSGKLGKKQSKQPSLVNRNLNVDKINYLLVFESLEEALIKKLSYTALYQQHEVKCAPLSSWLAIFIVISCEVIKGLIIKLAIANSSIETDYQFIMAEAKLRELEPILKRVSEYNQNSKDDVVDLDEIYIGIFPKVKRISDLISHLLKKYTI